MPIRVLLSIKPNFAEAIFNGTKKYEFRRTIFREPKVNRVVLYVSSPICKVLGEFTIEQILEMTIEKLWDETKTWSGIDRNYFNDYFRGRNSGYALRVTKPRRFSKPLSLKKDFGINYPPQSFCYLQK
jgi:predicted transcriptional regulator